MHSCLQRNCHVLKIARSPVTTVFCESKKMSFSTGHAHRLRGLYAAHFTNEKLSTMAAALWTIKIIWCTRQWQPALSVSYAPCTHPIHFQHINSSSKLHFNTSWPMVLIQKLKTADILTILCWLTTRNRTCIWQQKILEEENLKGPILSHSKEFF